MSLALAKQFRERRAVIHALVTKNLEEIANTETAEARRAELAAANTKALDEADQIKASIDAMERAADLESELSDQRGNLRPDPRLSDDPKERSEQERHAVEAFMRFGYSELSADARDLIAPANVQPKITSALKHLRGMVKEQRDLALTTSGAVLPNSYYSGVIESMLAFGGMRKVSTVIRTDDGNNFVIPTINDTANSCSLVAEAGSLTASVDPTLGSLTLGAFTYRTLTLISREMLQDASFNIEQWIRSKGFPVRLARRLNAHFTTGTGSGQPNGAVTASSEGVTMATGNSVVFNDLTQLEHSVDPDLRAGAKLMMHDTTLRLIKQMVDSQSRPLWIPGIALRAPDTILGYEYVVNQQMSALSSGGVKAILFGNFDHYWIRDVNGPVLLRDEFNYASTNQIAFWLFSRHDGDLLDPGTDPVKHAVTPSP